MGKSIVGMHAHDVIAHHQTDLLLLLLLLCSMVKTSSYDRAV